MSKVRVRLLGIGAVELTDGEKTVYVDAFSTYVNPAHLDKADLILVTHDDGDHFGAHETAQAAEKTGAIVVGPPGIAYPLLVDARFPATQLRIIYPVNLKKVHTETINGIKLKVYHTRHFNDWEPPHVSFLIELGGKRLYVTGDSSVMDTEDPDLKGLDGLLYSLVPVDLKAPTVLDEHLAELEQVRKQFSPRRIIPNHLIRCDWSVKPADLKQAAAGRGLTDIVTLEDSAQILEIE
jgi:L-ascorbate metabolism protein UlaG (beta-lactamase superfamily)